MAIPTYLAMTAGEIRYSDRKPENLAWMACHFSPYGTGLTNLPETLPEGSLLILNDRTPIHSHDPSRILRLLTERVSALKCGGVLLDFEQAKTSDADGIINALRSLPCPLCVSHRHIGDFDLPVFLPPVPIQISVEAYLKPWQNHKIWLEVSRSGTKITVTAEGSTFSNWYPDSNLPFHDNTLHCHYRIEQREDSVVLFLARSNDDIHSLLEAAEHHGVEIAVGLWQELHADAKTAPGTPERS